MKHIVCPISTDTYDKPSARIGAALTGALLVVYFASGLWPILVFVLLDYLLRVFTPWTPPLGLAARLVRQALRIAPVPANKGPKIFAWRVGFLFALAATALLPVDLAASGVVALVLAGFNLLDSVCNFCFGCAVYTYAVLPWLGPPRPADR